MENLKVEIIKINVKKAKTLQNGIDEETITKLPSDVDPEMLEEVSKSGVKFDFSGRQ